MTQKKSEVDRSVLADLNECRRETRTWVEWMAVDMSAVAELVARELVEHRIASNLRRVAASSKRLGILARLYAYGNAVSESFDTLEDPIFVKLANHRSDVVRQWCVYAINNSSRVSSITTKIEQTIPFAADRNMTVRECAWMAFRPHFARNIDIGVQMLTTLALNVDQNIRRFSVETSRPRSVWGNHIVQLKKSPEIALPILDILKCDSSRYVKLAVGNWLNDASKSNPEWVIKLCQKWTEIENKNTKFIVTRAMRTINKVRYGRHSGGLF